MVLAARSMRRCSGQRFGPWLSSPRGQEVMRSTSATARTTSRSEIFDAGRASLTAHPAPGDEFRGGQLLQDLGEVMGRDWSFPRAWRWGRGPLVRGPASSSLAVRIRSSERTCRLLALRPASPRTRRRGSRESPLGTPESFGPVPGTRRPAANPPPVCAFRCRPAGRGVRTTWWCSAGRAAAGTQGGSDACKHPIRSCLGASR